MSTDEEWEKWGATHPYYGVLTHEKYKSDALTDAARDDFFQSGASNIDAAISRCSRLRGAAFTPATALDFGCGVGRLAIPLARMCESVVGIDVSQSMLDEAKINAERFGLQNIDFRLSDDTLSEVSEKFDLVHTIIVLQHIPVARGTQIFQQLVDRIAPGGCGAIQVTYDKAYEGGAPPEPKKRGPVKTFLRTWVELPLRKKKRLAEEAAKAPEMQMNPYDLNVLFRIMQDHGVTDVNVEYTDHGGELGVFLTFVKS